MPRSRALPIPLKRASCALLFMLTACSDDAEPASNMWFPRWDAGAPGDGSGDGIGDGAGDGLGDGDGVADGAGDGVGDGSGDGEPGADPESGRLVGITTAHNAARAMVDTSPPLEPLEWSEDIAAVAQAYAEKLAASCSTSLMHSEDDERNGWGENIAWFSALPFGSASAGSAEATVENWAVEVQCYTYGRVPLEGQPDTTCDLECAGALSSNGCGHYTQVAWRDTQRVGCGVADCESGEGRGSYWVCNYDPPGNYRGQYPY